MALTSTTDGAGRLVIGVDGDLTIYEVAELRDALLTLVDGANAVELNLAGVGEIDSAGAQLLLALTRTLAARDTGLSVTHAGPAVTEVLDLLGLARHLPLASAA